MGWGLAALIVRGLAALIALAAVAAGYLALPPPSLDRSRSLSMLVLARDGSILRGFLSADGKWRLPVTARRRSTRSTAAC